ncbi:MAG: 5'-deoxynucleotidase [Clostridiaceae bacterium]|nr:5'-deoxynucleotidase [Clostridiaceae bacterium]
MEQKSSNITDNSKEKHSFMAFLSRLKYIDRWSLMRNTDKENIAEHSLQVAMIAHLLAVIKNRYYGGKVNPDRSAVLSLYHDANETITGDLPTPIKYFNTEMREVFKSIEDKANEKILSMLPGEFRETYREILFHNDSEEWLLVKAADKISAYVKCIEEEKSGNDEFKKAKETLYTSIVSMGLPEVQYFIDKFLPSFYLSLDEFD